MKRIRGLKLLEEREGAGTPAKKGDRVVYNARIFLKQGDEVPVNHIQAKQLPKKKRRESKEASRSSIIRLCLGDVRPSPASIMR